MCHTATLERGLQIFRGGGCRRRHSLRMGIWHFFNTLLRDARWLLFPGEPVQANRAGCDQLPHDVRPRWLIWPAPVRRYMPANLICFSARNASGGVDLLLAAQGEPGADTNLCLMVPYEADEVAHG